MFTISIEKLKLLKKNSEYNKYYKENYEELDIEMDPQLQHHLPSYSSIDEKHPMEFLRELKEYLLERNGKYCLKDTLEKCLKGKASNWWDTVEDSTNTYEDFEHKFKERFWSEFYQDTWHRKIKYGHYESDKGSTRVEYATKLWNYSRELHKQYTEKELIFHLRDHFDWNLYYAIRSEHIEKWSEFIEILQFKDEHPDSKDFTEFFRNREVEDVSPKLTTENSEGGDTQCENGGVTNDDLPTENEDNKELFSMRSFAETYEHNSIRDATIRRTISMRSFVALYVTTTKKDKQNGMRSFAILYVPSMRSFARAVTDYRKRKLLAYEAYLKRGRRR